MTLDIGSPIPEFTLSTDNDKEISSSDLKGKKAIIYFYPKDNTPGCNKEAEGFRDHYDEFKNCGTLIIGVSKDSVKSHNKFKEKFDLPFPLISDEATSLIEAFGCWKEKSMYGKTFMGIERSTFLIDENGTIQKIWRKVKVPGHVEEVLESAKAL